MPEQAWCMTARVEVRDCKLLLNSVPLTHRKWLLVAGGASSEIKFGYRMFIAEYLDPHLWTGECQTGFGMDTGRPGWRQKLKCDAGSKMTLAHLQIFLLKNIQSPDTGYLDGCLGQGGQGTGNRDNELLTSHVLQCPRMRIASRRLFWLQRSPAQTVLS